MRINELNSHQELKLLKWQAELARIDEAWKQEEESFLITWRYGFRSLPAKSSAELILGLVIGAGFIALGVNDIFRAHTFPLALVAGAVLIAFTLVSSARTRGKRLRYENAKTEYERRRAEQLLRKPTS
ncbi:MAG: hypothetical protein QM758_08835 [Armatimonas sp.]